MSVYLQSLPPDENRGPGLIAYWWITLVFTAVVLALRIYVRVVIRRSPGWDDWIICIAMFTNVFGHCLATLSAHYGLGRHMIHLSVYELRNYIKWITATQIAAIPVSVFVKISICIFVVRITPPRAHRGFIVAIWLFVCFLIATSITTIFVLSLQCLPLHRLWNPTIPGKCLDIVIVKWVFQGYGITGCLTDFACAFLFPVFVLRTQQVDRGTRNAVIFLLGLAILPGISCILKTYYADVIINPDYSWVAFSEGIWISMEIHSGIIIACLPILHPWIVSFFKSILLRLEASKYTGPYLYYMTGEENYSRWRSETPLFSRKGHRRRSERIRTEKEARRDHQNAKQRGGNHDGGNDLDEKQDAIHQQHPAPVHLGRRNHGEQHHGDRHSVERQQGDQPQHERHHGARRKRRSQKVTFFNTNATTATSSSTYSGKLQSWFDMSKKLRQKRTQKQTFFTNTTLTTATTATTDDGRHESWHDISKMFHSPNTRNTESLPETFRTIPPSPPPKLPPTPPPKEDIEDEAGTARYSSSDVRSPQISSLATRTPSLRNPSPQVSGRETPSSHNQGQDRAFERVTPADKTESGRLTPAGSYSGRVTQPEQAYTGRLTPQENGSGRVTPADKPSGRVTPARQASGRETPASEQRATGGRLTPAGNYSGRVTPARQLSGDNATSHPSDERDTASPSSEQPIRYSLMPHEDLSVFPTRTDKDFEDRVLRRMQALISPGPSRSNTPAMGAPGV